MKLSKMAWILSGALVASAGGVGVAACANSDTSSSGGGDSGTPPVDSGHKSDSSVPVDSGTGFDSANNADSSGFDSGQPSDSQPPPSDSQPPPDDSGGSMDCGSFPTLHPGMAGMLYCPFGPGGTAINCTSGQECCIYGPSSPGVYPPSTCQTLSTGGTSCMFTAMTGNTYIECEDPATDCPGGSVCCGAPGMPQQVPACSYDKLTGWTYSKCEMGTTCAAGEFQICESAMECTAPATCVPFKAKGLQMGFCM